MNSTLVYPDASGELVYVSDSRGSHIPDYSHAGYMGGGVAIPDVDVVKVLEPTGVDDTQAIQDAIYWVGSNIATNQSGIRGAILLSQGVYQITNTLKIFHSGIVLRGEGASQNGTVIIHRGTEQKNSINIYGGSLSTTYLTDITDSFVPVGAKQFTVNSVSGLQSGQVVVVKCVHTQKWVDDLQLTDYWSPQDYELSWERTIKHIDQQSCVITLNAPITSQIDKGNLYAQGEVHICDSNTRTSHVGIEDLILMSDYDRSVTDSYGYYVDEAHADIGVHFIECRDCWMRRVTGYFYYWCLVRARSVVDRVTIEDCAMLDGVSSDTPMHHTGTRDYYFCVGGNQILCQRCYGRYGRHTFIMASPTFGNVFLDCYAEKEHLSCEPHQNWQHGSMYDNVYTDAEFKLNRSEGGHGQRAANCMLWNITTENKRWWEPDIYLDKPTLDIGKQWAIGIITNNATGLGIANPSPESDFSDAAHVESVGTFVEPRSLYLAQLNDRLGDDAVNRISSVEQRDSWQSVSNLLVSKYATIQEFGDPDVLAWLPPRKAVWDGGGSDSNWSSDDNWGGTAPVAGDELVFDGTARLSNTNDFLADTSFSGITINDGAGAFTLTGNRISLDGDLVNHDADTQTVNLDMVLGATRTLCASNGTITVNGELSGSGGIIVSGSGSLTLKGSNSYDGVTTVLTNSSVKLLHGFGLGSVSGSTVVENGGWIEVSGGITVHEPLAISGDKSVSYQGALRNTGGVNTWSGPISITGSRIKATSGTIVITGGITGPGAVLAADGAGTVIVTNQPLNIGGGKVYAHSPGTKVFAVSNNVWGAIDVSGGKVRTDVPNAFPATATLQMGVSYATSSYVDLNGNDQTVGKIYSGTTNLGSRVLTTVEPATLTVNQSDNTTLDAAFTGALSLIKMGGGSLILESTIHTYTGDTVVDGGSLVVASGSSLGNSTNIVVTGGTLELQESDAMPNLSVVSLSGTGTLSLGVGVSDTVDKLFIDGVQQAAGTWGATGSGAAHVSVTHFFGSGTLAVQSNPPVPIWDAEGANSLFSTAENWMSDELPAFNGSTNITFGVGGSVAVVDLPVSVSGLVFDRDLDFLVAAGDGLLSVGDYGISAMAPTEESRTYTVSEDIVLMEDQTWSVLNNGTGATTLYVSGRISDGDGIAGLTFLRNGNVMLGGSNSYDGVTLIETGVVRITHSHALGSTNAGTSVSTLGGALLELSDTIVVDEPLAFSGGSVNSYCLKNAEGSNTLSSAILSSGGRHYINPGTTLRVMGGITGSSPFFVLNGQGTLIVDTTPLSMGTGRFYADDNTLTILNVAGNQWSSATLAKGVLKMGVADAMPPDASLRIGVSYGPDGTFDLNGFDQSVGSLYSGTSLSGNRIITSALPATLTVNQSSSKTFNGMLTGSLGFIKQGSATLTLEGWGSTTIGDIIVSNGTLVVAADSFLGYSTNICVSEGVLELQTEHAIVNSARVCIEDGGSAKIRITDALVEQVGQLWFGDQQQAEGTWGATGSGADNIDDEHFSGSGQLLVSQVLMSAISDFYVSPDGNATNSGSLLSPCASLEHARDAMRMMVRDNGGVPDGGVTVWLRGGVYVLTNTLELIESDSGSAHNPVVYRAYPGEDVRVHGAQQLQSEWFSVVSNSSPVWARVDPLARGNLMQLDLDAHGITDYGLLRERGIFSGRGCAALELFFDQERQQLARWPDVGETGGDALNGFVYTVDSTTELEFSYVGDRPQRWAAAEELWLHGFWYRLWADVHVKIATIDTDNSTIRFDTEPQHYLEIQSDMPYYAENLLEEVTVPGEWYLNRDTGILYFWPPDDMAGHEIYVSMLEQPLVKLNNTHDVAFRDITFEMGRADLIEISGGYNNRVLDCLLRNAGNYAMTISGAHNGVSGCEIVGSGDGGVKMTGGDRDTLSGVGNFVRNCVIHDYAQWAWTYKAGVDIHSGAVGHIVAHNRIYSAPHTAILFSGNGNYHTVECNDIWDVCKRSSDVGAIYGGRDLGAYGTIIRNNFVHNIEGFFGTSWGIVGIYLDDTIAGIEVFGNICYEVEHLGIQHGGGRYITMENNILVKCGAGLGPDTRGITWSMDNGASLYVWEKLQYLPYRDTIWSNAFPSLTLMPTNWDVVVDEEWLLPEGCVFSRNLGFDNNEWIKNSSDNATSYFAEVVDNLPDVDPLFVDESRLDLSLQTNSPAYTIPGFIEIPFAKIGRESDICRQLATWDFPDSTDRSGVSYENLVAPDDMCVSGMTALSAPGHPTWCVRVAADDIQGTNELEAVAHGDYLEISFSPSKEFAVSLMQLSIECREDNGDFSLAVRSRADDFAETLGSFAVSDSWVKSEIMLSHIAELQHLRKETTLRFYIYKDSATPDSATLDIDNIEIKGGTSTAIGSRTGTVLMVE